MKLMLKKLFLLLIKFIPVIQMAGMLVNNTLYYLDDFYTPYFIDFLLGNSLVTTILLFTCSYTFKFCVWHRIIITANFINILIANFDSNIGLSCTDLGLLLVYYFNSCLFIILATYIHIKDIDYEWCKNKIKTIKNFICRINK